MSVIAWTERGVAAACALALAFIPAALAQTPALDRVPAGTPVIVSVPSLAKLDAGYAQILKTFEVEPDEGPLAEFNLHEVMALDGLNKEGSLALAIMARDEGAEDAAGGEPPMVMVVPVSDYAKFVAAGGGDPKAPITEWTPEFAGGEPAYCKNLGNGFAAVGPDQDLLESFTGATGNGPAHMKLVGANGRAVMDASLFTFIADIQANATKIKEALAETKQTLEQVAQMGGQAGVGPTIAMIDGLSETLTRDGSAGLMGFNAGASGVTLHLAGQFKEGSQTAGYFNAKGKAGALLERVPNQPYLFATAMDCAAPGLKQVFKNVMNQYAKADPEGAKAMGLTGAFLKTVDTFDGMAFTMGTPPAMMGGGLFTNTSAYVRTRDAAGYAAAIKEAMTSMNGKTIPPFTYQTSYKPGAKTVGGVSVDEWSMRMEADQNDPAAQQAAMGLMMIYGAEGGPSGFLAPADGGAVMTYSMNTQLLEQALGAAKGGGLATDAGVKGVSGSLPTDRTIEGYVGVKSLLEMFMGMAAIMGGAAPELEIPPDLPPIGFGGTTTDGGVRLVVFAPTQVLTTIKQAADAGENMGAGQPEGAGQPRF